MAPAGQRDIVDILPDGIVPAGWRKGRVAENGDTRNTDTRQAAAKSTEVIDPGYADLFRRVLICTVGVPIGPYAVYSYSSFIDGSRGESVDFTYHAILISRVGSV